MRFIRALLAIGLVFLSAEASIVLQNESFVYLLNNIPANVTQADFWRESTRDQQLCVVPEDVDVDEGLWPLCERLVGNGRSFTHQVSDQRLLASAGFKSNSNPKEAVIAAFGRLYNMDAFIISMQSRDEFHHVTHSKEYCKSQRNLYNVGVPSLYIEHEPGLPYDLPCFSCYRWIDRLGYLTDFYIAADSVDNRKLADNGKLKPLWEVMKENYRKYQKEGLSILQRARPDNFDNDNPILNVFNDGRLLVNPTVTSAENWDSLTVKCSISVDGTAHPLDTVVTATYLSRDLPPKRYRIEQFEEETSDNKVPVKEKANLNLRYFLSWREWGCCSACCCTADECGENFAVSEEDCGQLKSFRKRIGYMSVAKIDPMAPIANLSTNTIKYLEYLLSSQPYVKYGIPLYANILSNDMRTEIIQIFAISQESSYSLGMFFDIEDCGGLLQKVSCQERELCQLRQNQLLYNYHSSSNDDEMDGAGKYTPVGDESCRGIAFIEFTVELLQSKFTVEPGGNYRIVVNEDQFGKIEKIDWVFANKRRKNVPAYDIGKLCDQQMSPVVSTNQKDVVIVKVGEKFDETELIGKLVTTEKKDVPRILRISFAFASKQRTTKKTTQVIKWLLICAGSLALVSVAVFTLHSMSVRQMRKKLAKKKALSVLDEEVTAEGSLSAETTHPNAVL